MRADRPNKDELRIPRAKKTEGKEEEKKDEEESSEERFSVEPEDNEEESDFDEDPPDEGEEKKAKEKKEEKKEPKRAKSEEREETPREAREAIAITGSTSTAMQRMLAQGLAETNRVNLTVVGKKLEIRRNKLKTEMLTDEEAADLEKEIEAFEAEQEKLLEEREGLQAQRTTVVREEPKGRKDQGVHDSRYRRAVAGGASHWKAWKEEKGRRRAHEHRRSGVGERAREDRRWHARHDRKLKDSDFVDNQQEDADIDTEVIDAEGNEAPRLSRGASSGPSRGPSATVTGSTQTTRRSSTKRSVKERSGPRPMGVTLQTLRLRPSKGRKGTRSATLGATL